MRLLRRAATGPSELVRLAGQGDAVALAVLRADLPVRTVSALRRLVLADSAAPLAVVAAARQVAQDGDAARGPLVALLLDGGARTPAAVGELLGLPEQVVLEIAGRRAACRAWSLLGADGLTDGERQAGRAHAAGCRPCSAVLDGEDLPPGGSPTG